MVLERVDPLREERDLHLGRAAVVVVAAVSPHELSLLLSRNRHVVLPVCRPWPRPPNAAWILSADESRSVRTAVGAYKAAWRPRNDHLDDRPGPRAMVGATTLHGASIRADGGSLRRR